MPSPYHEQHDSYVDRYLRTGHAKVLGASRIVEARHKDGNVFNVRFCLSQGVPKKKPLSLSSSTDTIRTFIALFEPLDLTVVVDMDADGVITDCSKNITSIFGHKKKYHCFLDGFHLMRLRCYLY